MKTRILITIGDFNGIGPEIILKTLRHKHIIRKYDLTVISPASVLEFYSKLLRIKTFKTPIKLIPLPEKKYNINPGELSSESGYVSGLAIKTAVDLCLEKEFDAMVTAPISKKALNIGGFNYDGHTEMLTTLCNGNDSVMFMIHKNLRIGFATTHPPLYKINTLITKKLLESKLLICYYTLKSDFKIKKPKIAVLSLNPHAGENGQIGSEEIKIINPVLTLLRSKFKHAKFEGPYPSDSYFGNKTYKNFDMTFAMYHDQGLIPFKMLSGFSGVNFTAGLPVIRTSPDHGTAFEIAGKNLASVVSLTEAIKLADKIVKSRYL
jgi:4-hydroxythreonine-4-phosphate dehydrogenase